MISRPSPPEDFAEYWAALVEEATQAPLFYRRDVHPLQGPGDLRVETLEYAGVDGSSLYGWIAYEEGARRKPAFLWLPPYGRESVLPNEYGTRPGFVSMSYNLHGLPAFHQEKYAPSRGYFAEGVLDPETWIFRKHMQNAIVATRVLQAQIEVDEDRIAAAGMSQGGGMAIWLGAWCPLVKAVCADMPFLGATWQSLAQSAYRYPLKELSDYAESVPLGHQRMLNTVSYFDTVHQASRCEKPTLVSLGEKDPAVRPEFAQAIFESLPEEKQLVRYPGGHDWDPAMVANNRDWLERHLG
jgi:cephalosporin-C deacetylase